MAGLWQVCEGTLNLSLIGLEPLAQVFFYVPLYFLSTHSKGFLRSNYNRITVWWQ